MILNLQTMLDGKYNSLDRVSAKTIHQLWWVKNKPHFQHNCINVAHCNSVHNVVMLS